MEKLLNKNRVGLALGGMMGLWHLIWGLMVLFGVAYPFMTFVLGLHFMNNPFVMNEYSFLTMILLILVTFVIGYIFGWLFAFLWNWFYGARKNE